MEFDIHGLLGVQLIDPSPSDVAAIGKQLGLQQAPLSEEPDVTLRFVKRLPAARLSYLGLAQKGFTDSAFFVFDGNRNKPVLAIPFDQLGKRCEILCESGLRSVPLLWTILGQQALAKGYVAVHASACVYKGIGLLFAGWAESGKTTALLGFSSLGAEYIGDEWVLLNRDGETMYGLPNRIELSPWHLQSLPHVRQAISRPRLCLVNVLHSLAKAQKAILDQRSGMNTSAKISRRVIARLQRQVIGAATPTALFRDRLGSMAARPDKIFLLISHNDPRLVVEPTPPSVMATRLAHLAEHEEIHFLEHYLAFKFAFPERKNPLVERSSDSRSQLLAQALEQKQAYTVWHPHPLVFSALYEQLRPLFEAQREIGFQPLNTFQENPSAAVN
ncbi:MAG TPA: hypothetical protein VG204_16990 [Terriglobia bacterium]|nr:hypothetical protein [Terriglobia bacterium]